MSWKECKSLFEIRLPSLIWGIIGSRTLVKLLKQFCICSRAFEAHRNGAISVWQNNIARKKSCLNMIESLRHHIRDLYLLIMTFLTQELSAMTLIQTRSPAITSFSGGSLARPSARPFSSSRSCRRVVSAALTSARGGPFSEELRQTAKYISRRGFGILVRRHIHWSIWAYRSPFIYLMIMFSMMYRSWNHIGKA